LAPAVNRCRSAERMECRSASGRLAGATPWARHIADRSARPFALRPTSWRSWRAAGHASTRLAPTTPDGRGTTGAGSARWDCAIRARRPARFDAPPRSPPPGWKPAAGDVRRKPPPRAPTAHPLRRHRGGRARCRWASPARGPSHSLADLDVRASVPLLSVTEHHRDALCGYSSSLCRDTRPPGGRVGRCDSSSCPEPPCALGSRSCSLLAGTSGDSVRHTMKAGTGGTAARHKREDRAPPRAVPGWTSGRTAGERWDVGHGATASGRTGQPGDGRC
jgi:hypothetical protein